jgi:hypothetical protein
MATGFRSAENLMHWRRHMRVLSVLHACEEAGEVPVPIWRLHLANYLADVLAPVWGLAPLEGRVLKRRSGIFYPLLQESVDTLVGWGMLDVSSLAYVHEDDAGWTLYAEYRLNYGLAARALDAIARFPEEVTILEYVRELALASSANLADQVVRARVVAAEDATYADPGIGFERVVDFGEWMTGNASVAATERLDELLPGVSVTRGEKLHFYLRHLSQRIAAHHG